MGPRDSLEAFQGSECDFPHRESNHVQFVSCLLYQPMAKGKCHPSEGNFISAMQPFGIHYIDSGLTVRTLNLYVVLTLKLLAVILCVTWFNTEFQNFSHIIYLLHMPLRINISYFPSQHIFIYLPNDNSLRSTGN